VVTFTGYTHDTSTHTTHTHTHTLHMLLFLCTHEQYFTEIFRQFE
jgi:hypothetical protein